MEDNVTLTKKIYATVDEATIRQVLSAYQSQVAPDLFAQGKTDIRRSFFSYLYFAPFKTSEEKMALMFALADANNDGTLTQDELLQALKLFLKTAASFQPQIEKLMGAEASQTYVGNLGLVYDDQRIQSMVDKCMAEAGDGNKISKTAWTEWAKSPDNIQAALGKASKFLLAL